LSLGNPRVWRGVAAQCVPGLRVLQP
jgi:hypothetical protein